MILEKIRVPKSDAEYNSYVKLMEELGDSANPGSPEWDDLEMLTLAVLKYEEENVPPLPEADPIDIIKFRMDVLGLKPVDMILAIGHKSTVSKVLKGERRLTLEMIAKISTMLDIPLELLIKRQ